MFVGDHQLRVKFLPLAKAVTIRAGALRGVEGEEARRDFGDGEAGDGAGELLRKHDAVGGQASAFHRAASDVRHGSKSRARFAECAWHAVGVGGLQLRHGRICQIDKGQPIGELQCSFETLGEALLNAVFDDDAVHHNFNVMLVFLVERGRFFDGVEFSVDADAGVAGALPLCEFLAIFALAALNDWCEQEGACAFGQGHDAVDHLADGLGSDRQARRGRIRYTDARPQKPHIVVNFGHGRHR